MEVIDSFHPLIARWFEERFGQPTEPQRQGWPQIRSGQHSLIAAPTGSGKTLAAFLGCLDDLVRAGLAGDLSDEPQVVYVSPLKALSNDVRLNLQVPLQELREMASEQGICLPEIRVSVRTGDTPQSERQAMLRRPPHILVTTPESLYLLVTADRSRAMLRSVRTLIVDEIHAVAQDKRGSHLTLTLERLERVCDQPLQRIGLSATQHPIERIARFLVGTHRAKTAAEPCSIVDIGHLRELDIAVEVPARELSAVCSLETWEEIYERLSSLIRSHRSTLIFVNTRRMAERLSHNLSQRLGKESVASHHGSLSKETRLRAERRLKSGHLKVIVATASLELGIDIGYIDLVCQIGSPRSINAFLQRVGRAGHSVGALPKGRLFALTRDELLESLALIRSVRRGCLDESEIPEGPLDILAQQIVAAASCEDWAEEELFEFCRAAYSFRDLRREDFNAILKVLSEGVVPGQRRGVYLHRDAINRTIKARRAARITALTSGGAIPENADYRVVTGSDRTFVGTVNEDFAIESSAGDIFLLGNTSWRINYVRSGEVAVEDAKGAPPTIPFWFGEAPGRTAELSAQVAQLRGDLEQILKPGNADADGQDIEPRGDNTTAAIALLEQECAAPDWAAEQLVRYVEAQVAAVGLVPTDRRILFERFFDETGGMQLVIHSPFGARVNRAWGLALRKRFCRSFDFELQASADDNGIVLSIGPQHSFPLEQMFSTVNPDNAEDLLKQAMLAVPMFGVRWRWNTTRALMVLRQRGGKKVPPPLQRFAADDLLAAVFPQQTACLENVVGDIPIPDHPLVKQTVYDCLHEAMDLDNWLGLLRDIKSGKVELVGRDTREPSPFSHELLNANPYAFLDDAPLEERRARAVATRRTLSVETLRDLGKLDLDAVRQVQSEIWPLVRDHDELHDALLMMVALPAESAQAWTRWFSILLDAGRATVVSHDQNTLWVATERLPFVRAAFPNAAVDPSVSVPSELQANPTAAEGWVAIVRGIVDHYSPITASQVTTLVGLTPSAVRSALEALEGEGYVIRGQFTPVGSADSPSGDPAAEEEWCERRALARIHRMTLEGLRKQIQPVNPPDYWHFLFQHQHACHGCQLHGKDGLQAVIEQLEGKNIAAGAWEHEILTARIPDYDPSWLDALAYSGTIGWGRLRPPRKSEQEAPSSAIINRSVPISLHLRENLSWLIEAAPNSEAEQAPSIARRVHRVLLERGAMFIQDIEHATGLLRAQVENALGQLAALGVVTADGISGIRSLVSPLRSRSTASLGTRRRRARNSRRSSGGRWSAFPGNGFSPAPQQRRIEGWSELLLMRYGVVFRDLQQFEPLAPTWSHLRAVYRQQEARGEIRGGRFISGVGGEQFAFAETVDALRQAAKQEPREWVVISACDPLNLTGGLGLGPRIPATQKARLAVRGGHVIATLQAGKVQFSDDTNPGERGEIARSLQLSGSIREKQRALAR